MSIFGLLRGLISNTRKSSPEKLDTVEVSPCSPVMALRVGDLIDSPTMLDLVVGVDLATDGTLTVATTAGQTQYAHTDTVDALRRVKHSRTGDWHLVPVR